MKKNNFHIGIHISAKSGLKKALETTKQINANAIQIFLKSPLNKQTSLISKKELNELSVIKKIVKEKNLFLVVHSIFNFAKDYSKNQEIIDSLITDIKKTELIGGKGIIFHIGRYSKNPKTFDMQNIQKNTRLILKRTPKRIKIIFENTAGAKKEIGSTFEELKKIYYMFTEKEKEKLGFCLDTCHLHVAGYSLNTKTDIIDLKKKFDKLIGWDKLICIHLNDAKHQFNSNLDGHQDLGKGTIKKEGLKEIIKLAKKTAKPLILETSENLIKCKTQIRLVTNYANKK